MDIVQSIVTSNPCYKAGRKIAVKGLMLHSVGCAQPSAQVFINTFNKASYTAACVHAFIDGDTGTVYQTLPWNHRGWHGGSGKNGCCNNTHIGVEMCEPRGIRYTGGASFTVTDRAGALASVRITYNAAVELFAHLCKLYLLDPMTDIISHNEGRIKGIATAHSDPEHLWGGLGTGYTMDGFRRDVWKKLNGDKEGLTVSQYTELKNEITEIKKELSEKTGYFNYIDRNMPESYKPTIQKLVGKKLLRGNEKGELQLTTDMMRILTVLDRAGTFE